MTEAANAYDVPTQARCRIAMSRDLGTMAPMLGQICRVERLNLALRIDPMGGEATMAVIATKAPRMPRKALRPSQGARIPPQPDPWHCGQF